VPLPKSIKTASALLALLAATWGCATVNGTADAVVKKGVVQIKSEVPRSYPPSKYRGLIAAMTGVIGVVATAVPAHFEYFVLLEGGEKITVLNEDAVAVGACIQLRLRKDPDSETGYYPLKFNDIEVSSGCKVEEEAPAPPASGNPG